MQQVYPRVLVITGGSSGIGAGIIERLSSENIQIYNLDKIKADKSNVDYIYCDLGDSNSIKNAFAILSTKISQIDIIFNNAGISRETAFEGISLDEWNSILCVNLTAPFLISQYAKNFMTHGGIIINTASVSGMVGMPRYLSYNVSKAGLIEMTKTLALELAPLIRVNAICPGYVSTPMQELEYTKEDIIKSSSKIPLKRWGKVTEIAALAAYLISDEASFITGQTFVIDGGETAGGLAS